MIEIKKKDKFYLINKIGNFFISTVSLVVSIPKLNIGTIGFKDLYDDMGGHYETMIFHDDYPSGHDLYMNRYKYCSKAIKNHKNLVKQLKEGEFYLKFYEDDV